MAFWSEWVLEMLKCFSYFQLFTKERGRQLASITITIPLCVTTKLSHSFARQMEPAYNMGIELFPFLPPPPARSVGKQINGWGCQGLHVPQLIPPPQQLQIPPSGLIAVCVIHYLWPTQWPPVHQPCSRSCQQTEWIKHGAFMPDLMAVRVEVVFFFVVAVVSPPAGQMLARRVPTSRRLRAHHQYVWVVLIPLVLAGSTRCGVAIDLARPRFWYMMQHEFLLRRSSRHVTGQKAEEGEEEEESWCSRLMLPPVWRRRCVEVPGCVCTAPLVPTTACPELFSQENEHKKWDTMEERRFKLCRLYFSGIVISTDFSAKQGIINHL